MKEKFSTTNVDLADLIQIGLDAFRQILNSPSAMESYISLDEFVDFRISLARVVSRIDDHRSAPDLDVVADSHFEIINSGTFSAPTNSDIKSLLNLYEMFINEANNSKSSERSSGLSEHDAIRLASIVEKIGQRIDLLESQTKKLKKIKEIE